MKNYVISLATAHDRREHIKAEFGKQGIEFAFFDAVTPDNIERISTQLNIPLANNQRLSLGEKACFLSHVFLWQKMIDDNLEHIAIFEDDVYLGENAVAFLQDDWLNFPFDIIKLETWHELVHLGKPIIHHHGRALHPLKSTHVGACGYIISKDHACSLMGYLQHDFDIHGQAIDHILFGNTCINSTIYQLNPALAIQSDRHDNTLKSTLEATRNNRYEQPMTLIQQFNRRMKTWKRSILKRLVYKIVPFK
ncbi:MULTISPECIES: glycosyltransferase family 25 protein [Moraxella]|uniref:Glycosyl transferase family 25 domain-containing protein n=1 Tax=Moraxella lacunata TaxID=477 RepID=A0A1B8PZ82_MORLA|nr:MULTISPECIES: glycosyltransferase family 25 protein [Moraxella]MBE9578290.1 glycosyltransferase family 25 protein [Moraxella sp. K1664]MBE9587376.1 glycosyltransferase family 25 protein [Moraxella sp. K1630]MBE9590319.1 glycosyltransferase family 25 protein [Moraxella sp. K127]MBE9595884.1 glycosyltransferase family 25 protein [Moraxella sp. K2450]MDH9219443.1 glycosyltransferase family 25 protein [Moraxella lacunata]